MASEIGRESFGIRYHTLANGVCRTGILTALIILTIAGGARRAFAAISFPPTTFSILNPDTGAVIGQSKYSVEGTVDGGILHGESSFYDGQSDVETGRLIGVGDGMPKLVEFDHTFYDANRTITERSHVDLISGSAICTHTSGGTKSDTSDVLKFPDDTWAGASVVIPMQHYLRAGEKELPGLHVFNCAPGPKIFAISLQPDPGPAVFAAYGKEALRVVVRPDFGWINVLIAPFVPKLHAWFDPAKEWAFVGDEAARYYQGTKVMLVKAQPVALAPQLRSTR
jgi:hypothetical protein